MSRLSGWNDLSVMQDGCVGEHAANGPITASVWPSRIASGCRVASVRALPSRVVSVAAEAESGTSSGLARD
jgi:hypothetical protein